MWAEIVANKAEFIGGTLSDSGDAHARAWHGRVSDATTEIIDITFDGKWFGVKGEAFSCCADRSVLGIVGCRDLGCRTIHLSGYAGHNWSITPPVGDAS